MLPSTPAPQRCPFGIPVVTVTPMPMQLDAASPGTCGYGQDVVMAMPIPAHAPFVTPGDAAQPCQPRVVPPRARGPSKRVFDPEASDGTPKQARVEAEPRPVPAVPLAIPQPVPAVPLDITQPLPSLPLAVAQPLTPAGFAQPLLPPHPTAWDRMTALWRHGRAPSWPPSSSPSGTSGVTTTHPSHPASIPPSPPWLINDASSDELSLFMPPIRVERGRRKSPAIIVASLAVLSALALDHRMYSVHEMIFRWLSMHGWVMGMLCIYVWIAHYYARDHRRLA